MCVLTQQGDVTVLRLQLRGFSSSCSESFVFDQRTDSLWPPVFQGQRRHPESERGGRPGCDPQSSGGGSEGGRLAGPTLRPPEETGL